MKLMPLRSHWRWSAAALLAEIGLPSLGDDVGDWLNPLGGGAVLAEALTVVISVAGLSAGADSRDQASPRTRPAAPLAAGKA